MPSHEEDEDALRDNENSPLWDRYMIYVKAAEDLGWEVKSFEEWLNS